MRPSLFLMRNAIYIFIASILPFTGIAQPSLPAHTADSLWGVWSNEAQPDSNRLKALRDYIWKGYLFTQPDSAFYYAQIQYDYALERENKKHQAVALNAQGISLAIRGDNTKAIDYYQRSMAIDEELDDQYGASACLRNMAIAYMNLGDYPKALEQFTRSLHIVQELGQKPAIALSLNNIGAVYVKQGVYSKAIDNFTHSLAISEELEDKKGVARTLNNIGAIYQEQKDYDKAVYYLTRSLEIDVEMGDQRGVAASMSNLGIIHKQLNDFTTALDYYERSLAINEEIGDQKRIASCLSNMGIIYQAQGDTALKTGDGIGAKESFSKALEHYTRSLVIREAIADKQGIAGSLNDIGRFYADQGDHNKAVEYGKRALKIASEIGAASEIKKTAATLWKANKNLGRHAEALRMHELYIETRDSIESEENQKEVIRQEYKYQYEKQAAADSVLAAEAQKVTDAQLAAQEAQLEQEATQRYALFGGLALLALFGAFMFNRFRVTQKQKDVIEQQKLVVEKQKHLVEEQKTEVEFAHAQLTTKNQEILDSIVYAKRIQTAILPPDRLFKTHLENSFVLYKPKDVVAGDFYWMETKGDLVLFAAADCTGHGVPGAMVSVICNNGLNRAVREFGLTEPGDILEKTRDLVISEFEKSEEEVKDGMDISLCALNKKTRELKWAGANNPLWIISVKADYTESPLERDRPEGGGVFLHEIKADKQPIGKYSLAQPFTTHTIQLSKGDYIYVFSDGYHDQFGGDRGKKYKTANFKRTLLEIASAPISEQKQQLDQEFESWRRDFEQLDDVCVIGVKV